MPEAAITTYSKEAQRLYERGLAAARGGQRRIAAGLLTRAVQLDPRHEHAWLWLSGVLDDPQDIEFCLRSVLKINPNNQQAQKGLAWVRQRSAAAATEADTPAKNPAPSRLRQISIPDQAAAPAVEEAPTPWWQEWRASQRWARVVRLTMLVVLLILLTGTTLLLRSVPLLADPVLARIPTAQPQSSTAQQQTVLSAPESGQAKLLRYLSDVQQIRNTLDTAVADYRAISDSATVSAEQIDAARAYRELLRQSSELFQRITPPAALAELHAEFLQGLSLEQQAFDDVLAFYTNYNVAVANRASLHLQEAKVHYDRARQGWMLYQQQALPQASHSAFTLQ